jgi:hypothetical protein
MVTRIAGIELYLPDWTAWPVIGLRRFLRAMEKRRRVRPFLHGDLRMTTTCRRAFVSVAATMTIALALGACVRAPSRSVLPALSSIETRPLEIRFDNQGREHVHVYLVGAKRQWLLGRVEPGAVAMLRLPEAALADGETCARLAVLTGQGITLQAARDARVLTVAQPASAILSQHWRFAQGQLTSLQR